MMMARSTTGKLKVESLILLSAVFIYLMPTSNNMFAAAAPPPPPAVVAPSSASTSPSSNGIPPSKMPADSNGSDAIQTESGTRLSSELHNQQLSSSPANQLTIPLENNEIAHHNEGESPAAATTTSLHHHHGKESLNGFGELSKVIDGQKASSFVDFPPYNKPMSSPARYQRQRRSYPIPSLMPQDLPQSSGPSYHFTRPDELELRLDDDRDREAFLKLMSLIATENNNRLIGGMGNNRMLNDDLSSLLMKSEGDELPDENDDGADEIDLGAFQRPVGSPYWSPLPGRSSAASSSEPINIMSSLLASEPPRGGSPHGLYGMGERPGLPFEIGLATRTSRDDDDKDGEWLEDSVPLRGPHYKTRRSGNTEFTFNPVKSHFRRYMRAVPLKSGRGLEFIPNSGRFGPIVNRRRRATAMVASGIPAVHWM